MDDEKVFVSYDEAVTRLPDGESIHTYRQSRPNILIGADWSRDDMLAVLLAHADTIEETGPHAQRMKYGLFIHDQDCALFIETKVR